MSYKDPKRKVGSQSEIPSIKDESNLISVFGYQKFTIDKSSLIIKSKLKFEKINRILEKIKYKKTFCDIGCSSGIVSILAYKNKFENITAIDHDSEYTDILKIINEKLNIKNINVITDSFGNDKNKYDVVFCGAIIHWIWSLTSNFNSFEKILNYLNNITNKILLIEWISENDHAIKSFGHITENKENYKTDSFEKTLIRYFKIIDKIETDNKNRILYITEKYHH
jgi:predicted RNA methylase